MHTPHHRSTALHTFLLGILTTLTVPTVLVRVLHAMELVPITNPVANAGSSIAAVILMCSTFGLAWRRSVLRARAERDELVQRIDILERRVEEAENAAWWGPNPQDADAERTVEFGPTVVAFRHRESRQRGAS